MSNGGVNFNKDVGTANVNAGEGNMNTGTGEMNIADSIDKSQASTTETHVDTGGGEFSGSIKGGDNIQGGQENIMEQVKTAFDELTKEAEAQGIAYESPIEPRAIPGQEPEAVEEAADAPEPVVIQEFESLEIPEYENNEDHPQAVFASVRSYAAAPEKVTEEEQKSLFSRMSSCVAKFATKENGVKALKVVASGVGALASLAPPMNVIKAVCETAASLSSE